MKRLIIADSHVGQNSRDPAEMIDLLRRAQASGVGEIIYLGDAFQYLIGMSKFWTSGVREVMAVWRELRQRGVRVALVEGNRDFFLTEPELAAELDWTGRRYEFSAGGRCFRLEHGDLVNRRDLQYRFWSNVSKSAVARWWARLLPRTVAITIVRRMEAHLATTNRKFRYSKPIQHLQRCASRSWAEGVDVLFLGHFHTPWEFRGDGRSALIIPAWLETRCSVIIEETGRWDYVDASLSPSELRIVE